MKRPACVCIEVSCNTDLSFSTMCHCNCWLKRHNMSQHVTTANQCIMVVAKLWLCKGHAESPRRELLKPRTTRRGPNAVCDQVVRCCLAAKDSCSAHPPVQSADKMQQTSTTGIEHIFWYIYIYIKNKLYIYISYYFFWYIELGPWYALICRNTPRRGLKSPHLWQGVAAAGFVGTTTKPRCPVGDGWRIRPRSANPSQKVWVFFRFGIRNIILLKIALPVMVTLYTISKIKTILILHYAIQHTIRMTYQDLRSRVHLISPSWVRNGPLCTLAASKLSRQWRCRSSA